MNRTFIHTKAFDRSWRDIGLGDDDMRTLQEIICEHPQLPPVIPGTGGVRKIRIASAGRGKSGGARVLYGDFPEHGIVYLFTAYAKNEQEDISAEERRAFKEFMLQINRNWRNRK